MFMAQLVAWLITHHHLHEYHLWLNGQITFQQLYQWALHHHFRYQP